VVGPWTHCYAVLPPLRRIVLHRGDGKGFVVDSYGWDLGKPFLVWGSGPLPLEKFRNVAFKCVDFVRFDIYKELSTCSNS